MARIPLTDAERSRLDESVRLYASLVDDLRDVLAHGWPTQDELAEAGAPILRDWVPSSRGVANIQGDAEGHPHLRGWTITSPVHALCERAGVARTQSRWYRLGGQFVKMVRELEAGETEGKEPVDALLYDF